VPTGDGHYLAMAETLIAQPRLGQGKAASGDATPAAPRDAGQSLTLDAITHRFGAATAVDDVTLEIAGGELVALLGPSGCGKTTLLRIIAGFIAQSAGKVVIGGAAVDALAPNKRQVGIVFQNYALFPHLSVAENIAYGLAARGATRPAQAARVAEMLDLVQMGSFAARYPRQLSGGQQQRIALARALAVHPRVLLLDEPFAALDKNLRLDMQIEIKRIQRETGITAVLVTHDQEEALSMADRIAVLRQGRLEQFGSPADIYDRPRSLFVNTFVGSANVFSGTLVGGDTDGFAVRLEAGPVLALPADAARTPLADGAAALVCIRPENLRFADTADGIAARVELGLPLGAVIVHEVRTAHGQAVKVSQPRAAGAQPLAAGTPVTLTPIDRSAITLFPAT
jgi:putative spermidine/putrescine transport system ATP-binding protein